jgi:hypothetical protein
MGCHLDTIILLRRWRLSRRDLLNDQTAPRDTANRHQYPERGLTPVFLHERPDSAVSITETDVCQTLSRMSTHGALGIMKTYPTAVETCMTMPRICCRLKQAVLLYHLCALLKYDKKSLSINFISIHDHLF